MKVRVTLEVTNSVWGKSLEQMGEQASRLAAHVSRQGEDGWWHLEKITVAAEPDEKPTEIKETAQ